MINKYVKNLFILCLLSFGLFLNSFVNGADCGGGNNNVNIGSKHLIGSTYPSTQNNAYNVGVLNKGTLFSQNLGVGKKVFALGQATMFFWDINSMPYMMFFVQDGGPQGTPKYYWSCPEITSSTSNFLYGCSYELIGTGTVDIFRSFLSTVSSDDYFGYYSNIDSYHHYFNFCISSHDIGNSLCFVYYKCAYNASCPAYNCPLQNSQFDNNVRFSNISDDMIGDSPGLYQEDEPGGDEGGGDLGLGGIEIGSDESAINYYEKTYGRTKDICYVGVDNYTDLWGTPVSFEQGSGLSIFQVFSGLYGNTDLDKVYVWLNTRLINYEQWYGVGGGYGTVGEPHFLATYNSGTNRVDLYSSGMSFPFANNPVAFYFMTDYITMYSPYPSMGSSVVSYCNLKILSGSFEEILDEADKNNIDGYTEQSNINKGLNSDGTEVKRNFPGGSDYGTGDRVVLTGNVGSWTDMTWEDMQYSGDVSLKDFFENAIDEMKSAMDNNMDSPFTGVLPQYIISAFLFVCLFRLLRK